MNGWEGLTGLALSAATLGAFGVLVSAFFYIGAGERRTTSERRREKIADWLGPKSFALLFWAIAMGVILLIRAIWT